MALSTLKTSPQKDTDGVRHVVFGHVAISQVVPDRTIAGSKVRTRGGQQFLNELVIRLVTLKRVLDKIDVGLPG